MFKRVRNMHPVTGIVIGVVATLVLSGTAIAVTDTSFTYSTAKTGYLSISPMDLSPNQGVWSYTISYRPSSLQGESVGCYNTGVHLPQNAKIIRVETYYASTSGASSVYLMRDKLWTDESHDMVSQTITDKDGLQKSVTGVVPLALRTVWNNVYSYGYGFCLGAGDFFEGARITYTYTNAGD